ncbi:hypothetical protein TNCV_4889711 [Trichonephila clavipes]|nr:hypothetical protein TNCV_4889711 [Trichonephila clavipes]
MAYAVLANPTRALQGTNRRSGSAMEESENDVGSLEQIFLYADEHCLVEKFCPCLDAEIVEVEIEVVSPSIVPSGNFAELKSYCHLYGAQGQRQAYL